MGDGFLATFDPTSRALRCATDILAGAKAIGLHLRAGVHTGEVEVRGDDIAGLAVTIAKRCVTWRNRVTYSSARPCEATWWAQASSSRTKENTS
jgi:hypothetical protein